MEKQETALREVKKVCDILNTWGNVLVPSLPDNKNPTAFERLEHFVNILKNEFKMSDSEIKESVLNL